MSDSPIEEEVDEVTTELYDQDDAPSGPPGAVSPPYSSVAGFLSHLRALGENGLPARIDRSYFGNASGGLIAQTRKTFTFFELIDEEYRPTTSLRELAAASEDERKVQLRELAERHYSEEIKLAESSGTTDQLLALMRLRGLNGATARKAATFYLHLAEHVGLPVSPYFSQPRASTTSGGSTTRRARRKKPEPPPVDTAAPPPPPEPATSPEIQKARYVEMLMGMAVRSGEGDGKGPSSDLLDRIERMLGHEPPRVDKPEGGGN